MKRTEHIVHTLADLRPGDYVAHPVIGGVKVVRNWQAEYEEAVRAESTDQGCGR